MRSKHLGFSWTPGVGPCETTLASMRKAAPQPDILMGEAWFMGETRKMFAELSSDFEAVSTECLQEVLGEIASGASAFGLHEEWEVWFRYMLPRAVPRCDERFVYWLLENLCSAFLQVDLATNHRGQNTFDGGEVLCTLGQVIMTKNRWKDGKIVVGNILHPSNNNPKKWWGWANVSGDLAASFVVCLRLVGDEELQGWVDSIFSIDCPYWRAQLLTWHVGARPLLNGLVQFPNQFDEWTANRNNKNPSIDWNGSHVVGRMQGDTIVAKAIFPHGRVPRFKSAFEAHLANADLSKWKEEILDIPALRSEVGRLVEEFEIN